MHPRLILRCALAVLLISGGWFVWWVFGRSPEAQVQAAQKNFLAAVEDRDWGEVKSFFADNYTDAYEHTRESAIEDGKKFLGGFYTLTLQTDQTSVRAVKGQGIVSMNIRLSGNGIGYSQLVLSHVNQLTAPWIFHWSNTTPWPWNWQVTMIHNDQVR